jgi:peptide/nickel transport system substrate-binding protein
MFGKAFGALGNAATELQSCMLEHLFDWNAATGEIDPVLAESYEWIDDTSFRVKLREGIFFSDGEELTAETILANGQMLKESALNTAVWDYDAWEAESTYTVIFKTVGIYTVAPARLGYDFFVFSKKSLEAHGGAENTSIEPTTGVGTGKYNFVEWVPGQYVMFERKDDYWNQDNLPY